MVKKEEKKAKSWRFTTPRMKYYDAVIARQGREDYAGVKREGETVNAEEEVTMALLDILRRRKTWKSRVNWTSDDLRRDVRFLRRRLAVM